eukprot:TRINITY_DN14786_c0_g1_i1.p1 TRINITY_DN14786_c0_g1~~TRINITY_DN14786_c0_g1_i1.p1  ORF type:complete len:507 (+),score=109.46 TRINITY_DN14786_c0_g1_i1:50-1522(+)
MVRSRRVFSAPPSQRPVMIGGKMVANPEQEIEALKNQLVLLQMATGQASMMEAQLMAGMGGPGLGSDTSRKTPWFPSGAPYPTNLNTEVLAFTQLVSLDQQERDQRDALILNAAYAAIQVWPSSKLAVDGTYATGTSEPSAPLSLVISNCKKLLKKDIENLPIQGHAMQINYEEGQKEGRFQIVSSNGIVLKCTLYEGRDPFKSRRQLLTRALNEVPHSRTLAILLRHILYHACATLVGESEGALSHEALLAMAIFSCRRTGDCDPGNALIGFLTEFGKDIDMKSVSINPKGTSVPKVHPDDQVSIFAFENNNINLAAGCTCWRMIKAHLMSFSSALKAFNPSTALTPLSTMIAHRPLWRRVNGQQAKMMSDPSLMGGTPTTTYSVPASSSQAITPESPVLQLPDNGMLDFGRTQSLTIPRSPMLLEAANSSVLDLAAQFPQPGGNKNVEKLAQQFPEVVSSPSSLCNSPAIAELVVRFPLSVTSGNMLL